MDGFMYWFARNILLPVGIALVVLMACAGITLAAVGGISWAAPVIAGPGVYTLPADKWVCTLQAGSECLEYRRMRKPV